MRLFIILSVLTNFFSCGETESCARYFHLPINLSPVNSTYRVGDTITVISKFPRQVEAVNSENDPVGSFDMAGIKWKPASAIYQMDTVLPRYSVFNYCFEYIKDDKSNYEQFQSSDLSYGLDGEYTYVNDSFYLAYKMVCLKPGLFILENGSYNVAFSGGNQDYPGKCSGVGFDVRFDMNEGADNNFDLLKESPDPFWNTKMVSREKNSRLFTHLGAYCIKVVP